MADFGTELIVSEALNPVVVFGDGGVDAILNDIATKARAHPSDISTPAGRQALASLAKVPHTRIEY